jgi:hypothetical protein
VLRLEHDQEADAEDARQHCQFQRQALHGNPFPIDAARTSSRALASCGPTDRARFPVERGDYESRRSLIRQAHRGIEVANEYQTSAIWERRVG